MSILNNIIQSIWQSQLEKLGQKIWLSEAQTKQAASLLMPLILSAMDKNTGTKEWADSLFGALDKHTTTPDVDQIDENDGMKILWHIFGNKLGKVEEKASETTWLAASQIDGLLKNLAPLLLGQLGEKKSSWSLDLSGLLNTISWATTEAKQSDNGLYKLIGWLLDSEGDGDYKDDLLQKWADMLMWKLFGNKA